MLAANLAAPKRAAWHTSRTDECDRAVWRTPQAGIVACMLIIRQVGTAARRRCRWPSKKGARAHAGMVRRAGGGCVKSCAPCGFASNSKPKPASVRIMGGGAAGRAAARQAGILPQCGDKPGDDCTGKVNPRDMAAGRAGDHREAGARSKTGRVPPLAWQWWRPVSSSQIGRLAIKMAGKRQAPGTALTRVVSSIAAVWQPLKDEVLAKGRNYNFHIEVSRNIVRY